MGNGQQRPPPADGIPDWAHPLIRLAMFFGIFVAGAVLINMYAHEDFGWQAAVGIALGFIGMIGTAIWALRIGVMIAALAVGAAVGVVVLLPLQLLWLLFKQLGRLLRRFIFRTGQVSEI